MMAFVLSVLASGCVVYEPLPGYYYGSAPTFDRAWNASLGAMEDSGIAITSSDMASGMIRGSRAGVDVSVSVVRQADGRTRVQFDAQNSQRDPTLANRFSEAYERRMGR